MGSLDGKRVLVVGASRGIGLATAAECAREGANVVVAARSTERLKLAVEECGSGTSSVTCDVTNAAQCADAVGTALDRLGGLDAMVYSAGISITKKVDSMEYADWHQIFDTNVFGACSVTSAVLPHLLESKGHAIYFGSESAQYQPTPWRGIGGYIASKRALDSIVRSYKLENPTVAFTNYIVGATMTEFGMDDEEQSVLEFAEEWFNLGYVSMALLEPIDHAKVVVDILNLHTRVMIDQVSVRARPLA